ncbi:MAG: sulfite exporter TauE/SafE family protein [Candidatus Sericytochromatia bacterium]|nr:sulfite exporter TauE/SafE family protein [Candidatus Tanganyikabacteria bacterium]
MRIPAAPAGWDNGAVVFDTLGMLAMGLAASAHCGAMCGALVGACSQGGGVGRGFAFQAGRLAGYTALGAACGAAGALLDLGAGALMLPRVAAILAGGLLVLLALEQLGFKGLKLPRFQAFSRLVGAALRLPGVAGPFCVGLALAVLPCGVLYSAAAVAAGSADPVRGALLLASFGMGGMLPLAALGGLFTWAWRRGAGTLLNRAAAVAILGLGLWTLAGRGLAVPGGAAAHDSHHHHHVSEGGNP